MFKQLTSKFKITKARTIVAGSVMAFAFMVASANTLTNPQSASADACDPVNIVYCGINGSGAAGYINSFQADYNRGANNGHNDLKAIYRWAGATDASVSNMNVKNTKVGTLYRNGDIKVDGKVVGHDAWVTARFSQGAGFQEITSGVWARKTTTSFAQASTPVIVHFNGNGAADFAVMLNCGNAIKFVPVPPEDDFVPAPNPSSLVCKNLKAEQIGSTRRYNFIARATANNTAISKYIFDFGDGDKRIVETSKGMTAVAHSYEKDGKTYNARVTVKSVDGKEDTSKDCTVTITTDSPKVSLACVSLTQQQVVGKKLTYTFVAQAKANNTTITNYVFTYSDGTKQTVTTAADKATATHAFAKNGTTYVTTVSVNSKDVKNVTSAACKVSLTTPKTNECKPGVPVGSPECETPTTPSVPMTTVSSTELTKTGPASTAAMFVLVTIAATVLHRYYSRWANKQLI